MIENVRPGDKVFIPENKRPFKVRCRSERFIICTKWINLYHTVRYFIIDLQEKIRGPDNQVFCSGYETDEQCEERLQELESGEIEVSFRNRVPLDCYTIEERENAKTEI